MINWPIALIESKYSRCYDRLIEKAQIRGKIEGYKEVHHIIPRSFGGDNSKNNKVQLTAREHYIAHALLWKMKFPGIYGSKMAFAFNTFINKMSTNNRGIQHTYTISSKTYEVFRKQYSQMLKEKWAREGANFKGKTHSIETKRIIGEKSKLKEFKRGPDHPNWGKPSNVTPEGKERQRTAIIERWADPEFKAMMIKKRKSYSQTPEGIKKREAQSKQQKGVKRDPSHTEKIREIASSRKGKSWEEIYTTEQITHMRAASKNKVYTPEGKERQREASRAVGKRTKSEEHRKKISESNKKVDRWWLRGENNPNFGKKKTDAERKLMSERRLGKKLSPEMLEQRRQKLLEKKKPCEHCGKLLDVTNYKRWHGDNCKTLLTTSLQSAIL